MLGMSSDAQAWSEWLSGSSMMYSPDMVMGGKIRVALGGAVDISTGDTLDVKCSLWLGSSKVNLV